MNKGIYFPLVNWLKVQLYRNWLKTASPRSHKCLIMLCYKAPCPYILGDCPWCKDVPHKCSQRLMDCASMARGSHQLSKHSTWTWLGGSHTYTSNHNTGREHPFHRVLCSLCAPCWGWPVLIPCATIWWFFKRINSIQDQHADITKVWHTLLGAPLLRSSLVKRELDSSEHLSWNLGSAVSIGYTTPPSLAIKVVMTVLWNRLHAHKSECETTLWATKKRIWLIWKDC